MNGYTLVIITTKGSNCSYSKHIAMHVSSYIFLLQIMVGSIYLAFYVFFIIASYPRQSFFTAVQSRWHHVRESVTCPVHYYQLVNTMASSTFIILSNHFHLPSYPVSSCISSSSKLSFGSSPENLHRVKGSCESRRRVKCRKREI